MSDMRRWLEVEPSGARVIHADEAGGADYTLCGYAPEGACMGDDDDVACRAIYRGKINCHRCLAIIRYAKSIPARLLATKEDE